jgi:hypothetical protein
VTIKQLVSVRLCHPRPFPTRLRMRKCDHTRANMSTSPACRSIGLAGRLAASSSVMKFPCANTVSVDGIWGDAERWEKCVHMPPPVCLVGRFGACTGADGQRPRDERVSSWQGNYRWAGQCQMSNSPGAVCGSWAWRGGEPAHIQEKLTENKRSTDLGQTTARQCEEIRQR